MDLHDYDQQIQEACDHYAASEKPGFALNRQERHPPIEMGELKDVILATAAGRRPVDPSTSSVFYLKAREWDERYFFWTLDLGDQRIIVKPIGAPNIGGSIYRRWLGVVQKFEKKPIAFPNLEPINAVTVDKTSGASKSGQLVTSAPAKSATADRPQRQKYASKRRAEQLALRSIPKKPKTSSNISSKNSIPTSLRLQIGKSGSKDGLSSSNESLSGGLRRRLPTRHGLRDDESSDTSALSSPPTSPRSTFGSRSIPAHSRKTAQVPVQKGLIDSVRAEVGQGTATTPLSTARLPAPRPRAIDPKKAQEPTENEIEELSRREAEVAQELSVFISLKKELNAIRRRKEELKGED
ncbi:MAG: hypothetical protein Q9184_003562 [Pyrenodesmia sp. 2 TL-2023]